MTPLTNGKLGVGVIGAGVWGKKLVTEYVSISKNRDDVELRWVADTDKNKLSSLASDLGLPTSMLRSDGMQALDDKSIQAVHIATPNSTHFTLGMEAMNLRKNVLLEKPMAMNMHDAVKLARKAEEESVVLLVGHIFRFNNAVRESRTLMRNGAIGKPLYYNLRWETLTDPLREET